MKNMNYAIKKILSSQNVFFCLIIIINSSYTSATLGNLEELTAKSFKMIEPWSLNHPHGFV